MFRHFCTATLLVTFCIAGPALAQQAGAVSETNAKQIASKIIDAWDDAYNTGNPAGIVALFAPDGLYLTPGGTMLRDHQEMEKAIGARIKTGWTKESINVIEADPVGDAVVALVDYTIIGSGPNAGKQIGGYAM
jgi:uncharacterized protein (TIGR02246 family)